MMIVSLVAMGWPTALLALTSAQRWAAARQLNSGSGAPTCLILAGAAALVVLILLAVAAGCRRGPRNLRIHW